MYAFDVFTGDTLWTYNAARDNATQFHGAPVIDEHSLVIGTDEGNRQTGTLYSLDPMSGTLQWKLAVDPGIPSDIVADSGRVFVVSKNDVLHSVDRYSGNPLWDFDPDTALGDVPSARWMASNPVIRDGRVIFASHDNTVHAVDAAATGEEAWWQPQDAVITSQLCLVGDSLMFGTDTMEMIVLDANDGSFVAAYPLAHVPVGTMSYRKPLLVFLAAGVEGPPRHVSALDLGTGHIEWSRGVPDPDPDVYWRVPRIHRWKSNVIMGSSKGLLVAYDETSGEPVWMLQLEGAIRGIGHAGDVLLVGTFQGMLHALTFAGNGGH